jgi:hypothetical protein
MWLDFPKCERDKKLTQLTVDTNTAKIAHEENSTDSMAYFSTVRGRGSFSVCRTVCIVCGGMLRVSTVVQYLYIYLRQECTTLTASHPCYVILIQRFGGIAFLSTGILCETNQVEQLHSNYHTVHSTPDVA